METIRIDILNPKAKNLLKDLEFIIKGKRLGIYIS